MLGTPLDTYQKAAMGLMSLMVLLTFTLTNVQALLWQISDTLVSAVLPGVVVDLTNDERSDVAASPLTRNALLDEAAQLKAEHMAKNGYFAHFAPDGTSPWYWFDEAGYVYAHAGENLAIHFTDSAELVQAWMDSPLHRANIVDQKFTEIGVGTARGRYNGHRTVFVVQLFGTPAVRNATVATDNGPATVFSEDTAEEMVESTEPATVAAAEIELETPIPRADVQPESENVRLITQPLSGQPQPVELDMSTEPTEIVGAPSSVETDSEQSRLAVAAIELPDARAVAENLFVRQSMVATSSGLMASEATATAGTTERSSSIVGLATQPHTVLQFMYTLIALAVFVLLTLSFVDELRHSHPTQVGYSVAMLLLMTGLYWLHMNLTAGALVV